MAGAVSWCGAWRTGILSVGALLLDLENPLHILAKTPQPILEPELDFETSGLYNGCVFPTGNVIVDGELFVYYGSADKYVCVALAPLMNYLIIYFPIAVDCTNLLLLLISYSIPCKCDN